MRCLMPHRAAGLAKKTEPAASEPGKCDVVLLLGPPASGKTTLGQQLAAQYGYTHFDVGAHVRESMPPEADLEEFVIEAVGTSLETGGKVLLNGFPKYPQGLELFRSRWTWARVHQVLLLEVGDENTLRQRARRRHFSGERPEDDEPNFERRLRTYTEVSLPVVRDIGSTLGAKIVRLNGTRSPESVMILACSEWSAPYSPLVLRGSRLREDPDEADIEVSVRLLSGEERMRPLLPARSTVRTLRRILTEDGETDFNLRFYFGGKEVNDSDRLCSLRGFANGATISMVREPKPVSIPPVASPRDDYPICFTADSLACCLDDGAAEVQVPFAKIQVGDMVRTQRHGGSGSFRRVQRVWAHRWGDWVPTFEMAPGCRVTLGHPVRRKGRWVKPEDIIHAEETYEEVVYQLEVEGHVDVALVGGVECALLGKYCGPDFGWNVFTRKTVPCDKPHCPKCAKAVVPGLSFSPTMLTSEMLPPASFEPY